MNPNRWHKIGWTFDHHKAEKKLGKNMYENVSGKYNLKTWVENGAEVPEKEIKKGEEKLHSFSTNYKQTFLPAD